MEAIATDTAGTLDRLVIRASGDIWLDSPIFTLLIDGVPVGGTYTTTASHAAGAWEDIVVTGAFGAPAAIGITFTNDYWDGTNGRNLYIDKITLNDRVFEGEQAANPVGVNSATEAALWSNGTLTFDTTPIVTTNTMIVRVAANSATGPAQFIVLVDDKQVGGVFGTTASLAANAWQDVAVSGDFATSPSKVVVRFVNDWTNGVDRSLYVDSITLGTKVYQGENADNAAGYSYGSYAELWRNGDLTFDTTPVDATNSLTVRVAGKSATGLAQFTVVVDGQQVGGVYNASSSFAAGEWQDVTVSGAFSSTPRSVVVNFVNDSVGGVDRTLYVDSITLGDHRYQAEHANNTVGPVTETYAAMWSNGALVFDTDDIITLRVANYAPNGGVPKFIVTVDGHQVGDVLTTSSSYLDGEWQTITLHGALGEDPQALAVTLLNDWENGRDQNIWIDSVTVNGQIYQGEHAVNHAGENLGTSAGLYSNGSLDFDLTNSLALRVSSQTTTAGPVQFTVTVDGKQIGGLQTVTASHAAGEWQVITLNGGFGSDPGNVAVNYAGYSWSGEALFVDTVTVNGTGYDARAAGTNYAGRSVSDSAMLFKHDALTFDTDHSNQPLTAFEGPHALSFVANSYVSAGNVLAFDNAQAWSAIGAVNLQALPQTAQLIFGNSSAPSYGGYEMFVNGEGHLNVRIISNFGRVDYLDVSGSTNVADGIYHVVGATYDGSSKASGVKLYVDGLLDTMTIENDTLTGSSASSGPLIVGNQVDGWEGQFYLRGALDHFALSDTVRPADYFSATAPVGSPDVHTLLAYDFDQGQGTVVTDSSSYHHDGVLVGGVLWV